MTDSPYAESPFLLPLDGRSDPVRRPVKTEKNGSETENIYENFYIEKSVMEKDMTKKTKRQPCRTAAIESQKINR